MYVFNGVKIEKALGLPSVIEPNRFYLIESGGTTRFYLSDTSAVLHLLNETPAFISDDTSDIILTYNDTGAIFTDKPDSGYREITLPAPQDHIQYEFWCFYGNGIRIKCNSEPYTIILNNVKGNTLESNLTSSTVRIHSYGDKWVVRYVTGEWDLSDTLPPTPPVLKYLLALEYNKLKAIWSPSLDSSGVVGYEYRENGGTWFPVGNVTECEITLGIYPETTYAVEVRSQDTEGHYSAPSNVLSATTGVFEVPVVSSFVVDSDTELTLNWGAVYGAIGYEVRIKKTTDGAWGSWADVGNVLTHQFDTLDDDTEYQAQVRAYDAVPNYSAASSTASATTDAAPIATDSDALAFLNAAAITDLTIAGAVDDLVIALKAAGVWTPLKAIYPFVGGTAATHKFNLKDPQDTDGAFRLTFTGSWTHSATGAQPSSAHADTHFNQQNDGAEDDESYGCYVRTNIASTTADMGVAVPTDSGSFFYTNLSSGSFQVRSQTLGGYNQSGLGGPGFFAASRTDASEFRYQKNGSVGLQTGASNAPVNNYTFWLGAVNLAGSVYRQSARELAFAFIGRGLTQTQMEDLYTAVQAFQTALSRNV